MAVPADVAEGSTLLEVTGRQGSSASFSVGASTSGGGQSFSLGSYEVSTEPFTTGPTSTRTESRGRVLKEKIEVTSESGSYAFSLRREAVAVDGSCSWERESTEEDAPIGTQVKTLMWRFDCECSTGGRVSQGDADGAPSIVQDGVKSSVTPVDKLASGPKSMHGTFGYRVDGDAGPIGAVELLPPGRAWIGKDLAPTMQDDLACLFTGLILLEDI